MSKAGQYLTFILDDSLYGLNLSGVKRILRVVQVTPLPKAPEIVLGVINVQGEIIPVFNLRKRFRLREREINLGDQMIIAQTSRRRVALLADAVSGVVERSEGEIIPADRILPGMEYVEGVAKLEDGMALIHDLDRFLSIEEDQALGDALKAEQG